MNNNCDIVDNDPPIRVLYIISRFELGGAEIYAFELSRFLDGYIEAGVASVLGNDKSDLGQNLTKNARSRGVKIFSGVNLPWKFGGFLISAFKLRQTIKDFNPDLIHLNTEVPEFSYVLCALIDKSIKRIPVIRTIHNTVLWSQWDRLGTWCERKLNDTPVVYVSDAVQRNFKKWRNKCGLSDVANAAIVYNPISIPYTRKTLVNQRIMKQGEIRLLFAGRFEHQKGCDLLADILKYTTVPADKKLTLQIYGEGSEYQLLEALRENPPQGWNINISPPVSDLVEQLPEFDILLFPSRFEGYGRMAAEAVLSGIPVVAFRLQVLMEIFPTNYPWITESPETEVAGFAKKLSDLLTSLDQVQPAVDNARNLLKEKLDQEKVTIANLKSYKSAIKTTNLK